MDTCHRGDKGFVILALNTQRILYVRWLNLLPGSVLSYSRYSVEWWISSFIHSFSGYHFLHLSQNFGFFHTASRRLLLRLLVAFATSSKLLKYCESFTLFRITHNEILKPRT